MAINRCDDTATSAADSRKFRCLVVELKKLGINSIEGLLASHHEFASEYPLGMLLEAIKTAKKETQPKSARALDRIMEGEEEWRPPGDNKWMDFEQMRLGPMQAGHTLTVGLQLIWSPVEVWARFTQVGSYVARHVISTLTGESVYVFNDYVMFEADNSPDYPIIRNFFSSIPMDLVEKMRRNTNTKPISPLIQAVCYA
jgi:hypothetical protein